LPLANAATRLATRLVCLALWLGALGCATSQPAKPIYTADERHVLSYCVGLSNFAMGVGAVKLSGGSADDVKELYASNPTSGVSAELAYSVVDFVYSVDSDSPYGYMAQYFQGCSENVAEVQRDRAEPASHCLRRAYIAMGAHAYKEKGQPVEAAYEKFEVLKEPAMKEVVSRVYAQTQDLGSAESDAWNVCMESLSAP
jgi:hypothetical protein